MYFQICSGDPRPHWPDYGEGLEPPTYTTTCPDCARPLTLRDPDLAPGEPLAVPCHACGAVASEPGSHFVSVAERRDRQRVAEFQRAIGGA